MANKIPIPRYTKGEWCADDNLGCKDVYVKGKKEEFFTVDSGSGIGIGYSHGLWCEMEDQSNVDLICAAPKMLEFIKRKAEKGDTASINFLKRTFKSRQCDTCSDRFTCFTEKRDKFTERQ
jgi:hypothetical protein